MSSADFKKFLLKGKPQWKWSRSDMRDGGVAELIMGMLERDPQRRFTVSATRQLMLIPDRGRPDAPVHVRPGRLAF